ncbi:glycosyltransferase family 8 protein [Yoonia sp. SS1-5]|uniref:Glycosyltransferase family 8 protein n=1 Tax=Yoonia rhodophyticola TaxID=3137370 RepID=A0AAN0NLJ2_9RHOB
MEITLQTASRQAEYRHAIILCCDARYLPFAALTISTIVATNPDREFDICIASEQALDTPPALTNHGVRMCQIDVGDAFAGFPTSERFSMAAYLRIVLPEAFVADYDRILYVDCDVFAVGGALGELFKLDLHGKPVGAVADNVKWKRPKKATSDQEKLGLNGPYFNSGVLLMDCKTYIGEQIRQACIDVTTRYDHEKIYFDQTVLNLALEGKWASLHPGWNWQWPVVRPLFEFFVDVQLVHFITTTKPWSDIKGDLPIRYRALARRFFAKYYPELALNIAPAATALRKGKIIAGLFKHMTRVPAFVYRFNLHGGDIRKVIADPTD